MPTRSSLTLSALLLMSAFGAPATAQSAAPWSPADGAAQTPTSAPQTSQWSAGVGYESFALRDIGRKGQPVDASPVAWQGNGPVFVVQRARQRGPRSHRIQFEGALVGDFAYRSPTRVVGLSADDRYRSLEGRYEYRRSFFTDRIMRGLDIDVGVQAIGSMATFTHGVPSNLTTNEQILSTGPAVVTGVRLRRWPAVRIHVDWINGAVLARFRQEHTGAELTRSRWGSGWLTDLSGVAAIRLTPRAALLVRYYESGAGLLANYQNFATSRRSLLLGATYDR